MAGAAMSGSDDHVWADAPGQCPGCPADPYDVVVLSLEGWDQVWRRNQFFVRELLATRSDMKILFVEPPVDVPHTLRQKELPRRPGLRSGACGGGNRVRRPGRRRPAVGSATVASSGDPRLGPWANHSLHRQVLRAECIGVISATRCCG